MRTVDTNSAWDRTRLLRDQKWVLSPGPVLNLAIENLPHRSVIENKGFEASLRDTLRNTDIWAQQKELSLNIRRTLVEFGICLLKDVPIIKSSDIETKLGLLLISLLVGKPITQRPSQYIVSIRPSSSLTSVGPGKPNSLGALDFHCDASDILALFCRNTGAGGGVSRIISSHSIYNEIARESPEALPVLFRGFRYGKVGESRNSMPHVSQRIPVFSWHGAFLCCRYIRTFIDDASEMTNIPLMGPELQALEVFEDQFRKDNLPIDISLQRGDLLLLNNYITLHGRGPLESGIGATRRHLMKLWINFPNRFTNNAVEERMRFNITHHRGVGISLDTSRDQPEI